MTQPPADPALPDDPAGSPDGGEHVPTTAAGRERAPSAAESGAQWSAADELLEGQPTALGE